MDIKKVIGSQLVEYGEAYFGEIMTPEESYRRLMDMVVMDDGSLSNFVKSFIRDIGKRMNAEITIDERNGVLIANGKEFPLKDFAMNYQSFVGTVSRLFN